jgi:curli production assembly/transport component CsgE
MEIFEMSKGYRPFVYLLPQLGLIVTMFLPGALIVSSSSWANDETASQDTLVKQKVLEEREVQAESNVLKEGINGLIIDNTVTVIGREFYHHFSRYWTEQGLLTDYNLTVREQPTARFGSRIEVEWNRMRLFQVFLPPTRSNIEVSARRAAQAIAQHFKMMEIQKLLFVNPDLAPDEF